MRPIVLILAAVLTAAGLITANPAAADPAPPMPCDEPSCTPGIMPGVVLGSYCGQTTHYVFGTTSWGRLVFCGSPRRYEPRWFRSPPMIGVKELGGSCVNFDSAVAQAPDGLFLMCTAQNGVSQWVRGDA